MQQETSTTPTKPKKENIGGKDKPRKRKKRGGLLNLLLFVGIIAAVASFFWAEQQRRDALGKLEETQQQLEQIKESTQASGQQVADEVLNKVRSHMQLPEDPKPTVATIIDVEKLRESSDFYKNAENGDHLILTETRAILYDPDTDRIIDVVPVVVNPNASPTPGEGDQNANPQDNAGQDQGNNNPNAGNQGNQPNNNTGNTDNNTNADQNGGNGTNPNTGN